MTSREREIDSGGLEARISALPGTERVRDAAARTRVDAYLVGGSVRDALLGTTRADLDVLVVGDHLALAEALGKELRRHPRFHTATAETPDGAIDIAAARAESYPRPGALPQVRRATLDEDLARRDFTVNAMAYPLRGDSPRLIDPFDGLDDLRAGSLRLLHERSIADDPTRALRAARYAARLDLAPDADTAAQVRAANLATVSADRVEAELLRLADEVDPRPGFELLAEWGLLALPAGAGELIDATVATAMLPQWDGVGDRGEAILAIARGEVERAAALAAERPASPSTAVAAARGHSGTALLVARALGAEWLDAYVAEHRHVRLSVSGHDLIEAGIAPGPALGTGLAAALRAKLDGETSGREDELAAALAAARQTAT